MVSLLIIAVAVAGCEQPHPNASTPTSSQSPPTSPAPMVASDLLDSILLTDTEVNSAMGASSMQPTTPIAHAPREVVERTLSNPACLGAFFVGETPAYQGSGYTAARIVTLHEMVDNPEHRLGQAVVSFPSADRALAFLRTSVGKWRACAGQTLVATHLAQVYRWTVGNLVGDVPAITQLNTLQGGNGYVCQRELRALLNVVLDVNACGYQISDQAGRIADKMAATATRQAH
ncbi:sensor domain-containing protein [Mycolicibacterium moriokaense]|nr:sensor domain-containing protein [Mycolicibacterium moriokaense]